MEDIVMKLNDVKSKIDNYFDGVQPEELLQTLSKYGMKTCWMN